LIDATWVAIGFGDEYGKKPFDHSRSTTILLE
jgi:hypothetical protein